MKKTKFKQTEIGKIPEEWNTFQIEQVAMYINRGISPKYVENGFYVLNQKCVRDGKLTKTNVKFHDKDKKFPNEKKLIAKDIIINSTGVGTLGRVAQVTDEFEGFVADSHVTIVRIDQKKANPDFISFYLRMNQSELENMGEGTSGQQELPRESIKKIIIPFPPLPEQRAIAKVLSDLDDKIELNQQMNKTLEAIGQAIFKRWFVDFEFPNEKGKPYKSSGGKMVDSELGKIPEGWKVSKIGSELKTILGGTPDRDNEEYWNGNIPWINSGKVNEFRIIEPTEFITEEGMNNSATKLLPKKTTVIAITGATLGQVSLLEIDSCANQSVVGVIGSDSIPNEYVYMWIKNNINSIISSQTGGAQQHINKENVNNSEILMPSDEILKSFKKNIESIFSQISNNCFEVLNISEIRDSLLPRLMSGKIRVPL